jgi:hypothetical protein
MGLNQGWCSIEYVEVEACNQFSLIRKAHGRKLVQAVVCCIAYPGYGQSRPASELIEEFWRSTIANKHWTYSYRVPMQNLHTFFNHVATYRKVCRDTKMLAIGQDAAHLVIKDILQTPTKRHKTTG